jgi:C4-dicarboxylate-specific signal transduction histidine kinase
MNLLTNARDALNERYEEYNENKVLIIQVRPFLKADEQWVRTTIEDHGPGIDEKVAEKIFDPFFTTKGREKGTGLGLSISHGIVRDHGGILRLETKKGTNEIFTLN